MVPDGHMLTLTIGDFVEITASSSESHIGTYTVTGFNEDGTEPNSWIGVNVAFSEAGTGVALSITRQQAAGVQASVSYVYTKVQAWPDGSVEESAPSPPTTVYDVSKGQGLVLSGFESWEADAYLTRTRRIYRLASGTSGAEYMYLAEIALGETTYNDYVQTSGEDEEDPIYAILSVSSEVLETTDWIPPPSNLKGLTQCGNGMLIGYVGNKLYVSEPWVGYAWPDAYTLTFDYDIVALGVYNESIVVLTEAYPYIVTGLDPQSLSQIILPYEQACVSARGVVETNVGIIYPCPDGLFLINGTQGKLLTKNIYTKEQWAALGPSSLISFFYDDMYLGLFSGTGTGIAFNFKEDQYVVDINVGGASFAGGFLHAEDDALYLVDGVSIRQWAEGEYLECTWKSKLFRTGELHNFACAAVVADGEVTFKLYADGALKHTQSVVDEEMFRLPGGYRSREWEFELAGISGVDSVAIGQQSGELF